MAAIPEPEPERAADRSGIFGHFSAWIAAHLAYFCARLQLLGLEGKQAAIQYAIIAALAVGALILLIFGYLFFVLALIFLVAWLAGGGNAWIWVTFAVAALHVGLAVACLVMAKMKLAQPVFGGTLEEFKKDQEWLKS